MNDIALETCIVTENNLLKFDGITFSNFAYLKLYIDNVDIFSTKGFEDTFIVLSELKKSTFNSGSFLIFTSVSGIADDAGWDLVKVMHLKETIRWFFERENEEYQFTFSKKEYLKKIDEIDVFIKKFNFDEILEPGHIIFPDIL